jgi:hypothetical protein
VELHRASTLTPRALGPQWAGTALFRIHELTGSALGLKSAVRRLRGALAEPGADEVRDVDSVPLPPNPARIVQAIRSRIDGTSAPISRCLGQLVPPIGCPTGFRWRW